MTGARNGEIIYRRGTSTDTEQCFDIFLESATDLARRLGVQWEADHAGLLRRFEPMFRRLADHAAEWWVAEDAHGGKLIGYARSVARDGLFELSEFFVRPGGQSAGVGRRLLERAFPLDRSGVRAIIATVDLRALSRYYRAGTVVRFPIMSLLGAPAASDDAIGLEIARASMADIRALTAIETEVLEFARDPDELAWLLEQREGYLYRRGGRPVGLGFIGESGAGPVMALDAADQVPILQHIESRANAMGVSELTFEVPMINEVAMRHLLGRGFQMDQFLTLLLSSRPFGQFDRLVCLSPPFIL